MFQRHEKEGHVGTHTSCIVRLMGPEKRKFEGLVDQLVGMMRARGQVQECAIACFCMWGKHRSPPKLSNAVSHLASLFSNLDAQGATYF